MVAAKTGTAEEHARGRAMKLAARFQRLCERPVERREGVLFVLVGALY
jgi:hypothetical protein